jgi:hypothetical protein
VHILFQTTSALQGIAWNKKGSSLCLCSALMITVHQVVNLASYVLGQQFTVKMASGNGAIHLWLSYPQAVRAISLFSGFGLKRASNRAYRLAISDYCSPAVTWHGHLLVRAIMLACLQQPRSLEPISSECLDVLLLLLTSFSQHPESYSAWAALMVRRCTRSKLCAAQISSSKQFRVMAYIYVSAGLMVCQRCRSWPLLYKTS